MFRFGKAFRFVRLNVNMGDEKVYFTGDPENNLAASRGVTDLYPSQG